LVQVSALEQKVLPDTRQTGSNPAGHHTLGAGESAYCVSCTILIEPIFESSDHQQIVQQFANNLARRIIRGNEVAEYSCIDNFTAVETSFLRKKL
jgi:hypothetical protein